MKCPWFRLDQCRKVNQDTKLYDFMRSHANHPAKGFQVVLHHSQAGANLSQCCTHQCSCQWRDSGGPCLTFFSAHIDAKNPKRFSTKKIWLWCSPNKQVAIQYWGKPSSWRRTHRLQVLPASEKMTRRAMDPFCLAIPLGKCLKQKNMLDILVESRPKTSNNYLGISWLMFTIDEIPSETCQTESDMFQPLQWNWDPCSGATLEASSASISWAEVMDCRFGPQKTAGHVENMYIRIYLYNTL